MKPEVSAGCHQTLSRRWGLVDWAVEMGRIGYGRTREQMSMMVKKILDKDGRQNPFVDNRPGKDWWYAFLRRHPELAIRTLEHLQLARAAACSEDVLSRWSLRTLLKYGMQMKLGALSVPNQAKFSHWLEQKMSTMLPQIQRSRLLLCVQSLLRGMLFHLCTYFQARDFGTTHLRVVSVELTLANLKRVG